MVSKGCDMLLEFEQTTLLSLGYTSAGDTVIFATGPLGLKRFVFKSWVNVRLGKPGQLYLSYFSKLGRQYCMTYLSVLKNELRGLECETYKFVELRGLGYKVNVTDRVLFFNVGFSHTVAFKAPYAVHFSSAGVKGRIVQVYSSSFSQLTQTIASLKAIRPPGVYKERGIYQKFEVARVKAGKKKKFS